MQTVRRIFVSLGRGQFIIVAPLLILMLAACGRAVTTPSSVLDAPPSEPAVMVEVTRVVEVTSTPLPVPNLACALENLNSSNELVIGAILPLSNPGAMRSGFAMQAALSMAVDEVNNGGGLLGKSVHLITYDSAGIPSRGLQFAKRLVEEDCARAIVGLYHSNVASAVIDYAHERGVPVVLAEPMTDDLTGRQYPEVFRLAPPSSELINMNAAWLAQMGDLNGDGEMVVVNLAENSVYGQVQIGQLTPALERNQITVKNILVDLPSKDFSSAVARVLDLELIPDVLFINIRDDQALELQRQLMDAGIGPEKDTLIVTGSAALNAQQFWTKVPNGTGTIVKQLGPWPSTVPPIGQIFAMNYRRYFERWPERYAFAAYDAFHLVADAIRRADSLEHVAVIQALEQADIELAAGHYTFPYGSTNSPRENGLPDYWWHQWPDPPMLFLQYTAFQQPSEDMAVIWPSLYASPPPRDSSQN